MKENTDDWRWSVLQLRIIIYYIERITFPSTIIEFGEVHFISVAL